MGRKWQGPAAADSSFVIREARLADAGAVHDLLYEFNGEALSPDTLALRMRQLDGQETVFLAEQGGLPAGLLVLRIVPTISEAQDWAEITEMVVRQGFRRQGIGTALIYAAVERSRSQGCVELNLWVDPANREAQAFYRACGFLLDSSGMRRRL